METLTNGHKAVLVGEEGKDLGEAALMYVKKAKAILLSLDNEIERLQGMRGKVLSEMQGEVPSVEVEAPLKKKYSKDRVTDYLVANGASRAIDIARKLEMGYGTVAQSLKRLKRDGVIRQLNNRNWKSL